MLKGKAMTKKTQKQRWKGIIQTLKPKIIQSKNIRPKGQLMHKKDSPGVVPKTKQFLETEFGHIHTHTHTQTHTQTHTHTQTQTHTHTHTRT